MENSTQMYTNINPILRERDMGFDLLKNKLLLSPKYFLYLIKFIESLNGGKVVDIKP